MPVLCLASRTHGPRDTAFQPSEPNCQGRSTSSGSRSSSCAARHCTLSSQQSLEISRGGHVFARDSVTRGSDGEEHAALVPVLLHARGMFTLSPYLHTFTVELVARMHPTVTVHAPAAARRQTATFSLNL
eukprot:906781-Rhodomonas_salina.1